MIIASIDIGTNTVLLLIAEVDPDTKKITPIFNDYKMPRIGRGLLPGQPINEQNLNSLLTVLEIFHINILKYKCEKVIVTGTNALRIASNADVVKHKLKSIFNFDLEIISGEKEAEYAFLGALSNSTGKVNSFVIDIGGGSTEIIFGNVYNIEFKKSFPIGSVSASEKFFRITPPTLEQMKLFELELNTIFNELHGSSKPDKVIAIAGTATTLACMNNGLKDFVEEVVEGSTLTGKDLLMLINELKKLNPEQILHKFGPIMNGREDIILAGTIILHTLSKIIGINEIEVSSRGIRYGAIVNLFRSGFQ